MQRYALRHEVSLRNAVALVLRLLLGFTFVASAIGKLIGIDAFEIYIFSFGIVSLPVAMVGARVVIVVELLLGVALTLGVQSRRVALTLLLMVVAFTAVLGYALLIGRSGDCHCFGALAQVDAGWSLVKNAVLLLLLLLLLLRLGVGQWRVSWWWLAAGALLLTAGVFALSMPDNWMFGTSDEPVDTRLLGEVVEGDSQMTQLYEGRKVLVLASARCRYCHMAMQKLATIVARHALDTDDFAVVMPAGEPAKQWDDDVAEIDCRRYYIDVSDFLHITYGQRPIVLLLNDGAIEASYHYRNIDEGEIARFLR